MPARSSHSPTAGALSEHVFGNLVGLGTFYGQGSLVAKRSATGPVASPPARPPGREQGSGRTAMPALARSTTRAVERQLLKGPGSA